MNDVLVLDGHPDRSSFCAVLAVRYTEAVRAAGPTVHEIAVADLPLDTAAALRGAPPPAWVRDVRAEFAACRRWTIVEPMLWGGPPPTLEAVFVAVLGEGFACHRRDGGPMRDGLMTGRSARATPTTDTPPWFLRSICGQPLVKRPKRQGLGFCGFAPVGFTLLGPMWSSTAQRREAWLAAVTGFGRSGVRAVLSAGSG